MPKNTTMVADQDRTDTEGASKACKVGFVEFVLDG